MFSSDFDLKKTYKCVLRNKTRSEMELFLVALFIDCQKIWKYFVRIVSKLNMGRNRLQVEMSEQEGNPLS